MPWQRDARRTDVRDSSRAAEQKWGVPLRSRSLPICWVSAVKLVDGLAGESPASADYPVRTVVISGDGAGDQTVGSPEVNVLVGWMRVQSAPTRRASKAAGRSASEPWSSLENALLTRIGV